MNQKNTAIPRRDFLQMIGTGVGLAILPGCATTGSHSKSRDVFSTGKKFVVGHRGACAYAPENTLESYDLAIKQGVEYVEQDLQITRDGVLVCCHDLSLDRVTNVEEVFPDRFTEQQVKGRKVKRWLIHDFTLKEIKQLDAGERFNPKFKGAKIPTWQEAIDFIKGRSGLCPETKGSEYYGKLGFDMEAMVVEVLKRNGMDKARASSSTPILIQSFSKQGLKKLSQDYSIKWPMLWLTFVNTKWTPAMFDEAQQFLAAIGPYKKAVNPSVVEQAHARGLKVVPYTFTSSDKQDFEDVGEEMRHYLYELNVDGMFTDNPDRFPRANKAKSS